ncbi:MAG: hypothetical protein VYA51_12805 [Planctomycetota bacterium]|nr:hypothetical protein [Planctomycetota bacterium]
MSADLQIAHYAGGRYDAVLADTEAGEDFVLIGDDAATHPQATVQRITYAIGVWLGESRFDRSIGFPWRQAVLGKAPIQGVPVFLQTHIEAVEGVEGLLEQVDILYDAETRRIVIPPLRVQGKDFEIPFDSEIVTA